MTSDAATRPDDPPRSVRVRLNYIPGSTEGSFEAWADFMPTWLRLDGFEVYECLVDRGTLSIEVLMNERCR